MQHLSEQEQVRREKLEKIKALGVDQITQEEVEQAAALLILAAAMNETDQAADTNNNSSEDSYTEDERKSALIHDVVETNLADNIVYE